MLNPSMLAPVDTDNVISGFALETALKVESCCGSRFAWRCYQCGSVFDALPLEFDDTVVGPVE